MLKKICPLCLLFLLYIACASGPAASAEATAPFFSSAPAANGLVFIGAAGKRSDPQETLQFALYDAAQRVALYTKVSGEYAVENNIGSGAFDYTGNTYTSLSYDEEGAKQYVAALQFNADTDTLEIEHTFIVRTTCPLALSVPVNYRPVYSKAGQKPDWVDNPPLKIEGYEVGVGYSGRYSSLVDTLTHSCHNAIFSIIRNINTTSRSSNMLYQDTGSLFGYKTSSNNVTYSYGTLTGYYVLDTWIDPQTKSVWTLAIARKTE